VDAADWASPKVQGDLDGAGRISGERFPADGISRSVAVLEILITCHADAGSSIKEKKDAMMPEGSRTQDSILHSVVHPAQVRRRSIGKTPRTLNNYSGQIPSSQAHANSTPVPSFFLANSTLVLLCNAT
jgi:hypothetical protein